MFKQSVCTDCETNSFLGHSIFFPSMYEVFVYCGRRTHNIRMEMFILLFRPRPMSMLCHTCFRVRRCFYLRSKFIFPFPSLHCRRRQNLLLSAAIASGTRNRKTWCSLNANNCEIHWIWYFNRQNVYRFVVPRVFVYGSVLRILHDWKNFRRRKKCIMLNYKFSPLIKCVTVADWESQIKIQNTP